MELARHDIGDVVTAAAQLRRDRHVRKHVAAMRHRMEHHAGHLVSFVGVAAFARTNPDGVSPDRVPPTSVRVEDHPRPKRSDHDRPRSSHSRSHGNDGDDNDDNDDGDENGGSDNAPGVISTLALGLFGGAALGIAARAWMRLIADDPEFTWDGTIFIVMAFTIFGFTQSIVAAARRRTRRRWTLTVARVIGTVGLLPLFVGAGA